MRIGIFGDSYGQTAPARRNEKSDSWVNHLANMNNKELRVTNHSLSGTSLYYSMTRFLKRQQFYDKIIFLVTSQERIELGNPFVDSMKSDFLVKSMSGYYQTQLVLREPYLRHEFDDKVYKAAADYFIYVQNPDSDNFKHQLMVEKIRSTRPDTLILPCFLGTVENVPFALRMVSDIDTEYYKKSWETGSKTDLRHCHMNNENNIIFAEKIYNWIKTDTISLEISDFVEPTEPPEYYGF